MYITKFSKKRREGDEQRRRRKKRKKEEEEEEEGAIASWRHPCFVVVFFLFSFISVFFSYKWDFSCFSLVSIYRPKQPDFADTLPIRPVFFPVRNKGVICTCALIGTVYSSRYGMKLTFLILFHFNSKALQDLARQQKCFLLVSFFFLFSFFLFFAKYWRT